MQLLLPLYVPAIVVAVTPLAVPLIVALHVGEAEIDPAGKLTENVSDAPDTVPATVPLKSTSPL